MKFSLDQTASLTVSRHAPGTVTIAGTDYHRSLILLPDRVIADWPCGSSEELDRALLEPALAARPELIVLGTGRDLQMPDTSLIFGLQKQGVGFEFMDTAAACRTYNIVAGEGRRVAAALIIEGAAA